ncbi:MAG: hypothetical protein ACT4OI_08450 [Methanobacteriota archaeon]
MTTEHVTIPGRAVARWRGAMALMGLGLATTTAGLGWDFYVHEVAREAGESIFAAPHLLIFVGFALSGLGFLVALAGVRPLLAPRPA